MTQKMKRKTMRVASARPPARPVDPTKLRKVKRHELAMPGAPDDAYIDRAASLYYMSGGTLGLDSSIWFVPAQGKFGR